jgi:hypothetical protein
MLAAWLTITVILAALLLFALNTGRSSQNNQGTTLAVTAPAAGSSLARPWVDKLAQVGGVGIAAGQDTKALLGWTNQVVYLSQGALAARVGEGATQTDSLVVALNDVNTQAKLMLSATTPVMLDSARTRVLLAIDEVNLAIRGVGGQTLATPNPTAPLGASAPTAPAAISPQQPSMPTLPKK